MTESDTKDAVAEPAASDEAKPGQASSRERSEEAECEDAMEALVERSAEVERLEAEKADLTDRLVRTAAEMENLRKRSEREIADARKYAVTRFATDMLVVGDNLRRTLGAMPVEQREAADESLKALLDGVEMTEREMDRLMEKHGISRIAAKGERFDPHRHQAMFEVPDSTVPPGTVVEVVQEGYQIGDRVLRAAMVGISKAS